MKSSRITSIIRFEFLNSIRNKTFLLLSFLPPVFFLLIFILNSTKNTEDNLAIVNNTHIDTPIVKGASLNVTYVDSCNDPLAYLNSNNANAVLVLSSDSTRVVNGKLYTNKNLQPQNFKLINDQIINKIADYNLNGDYEKARMQAYDFFNLDHISFSDTKLPFFGLAIFVICVIYFIVFQFSGSLMKSVSLEKGNKISEILLSSMKAEEIIIGKLSTGVLLAIVQIIVWISTFLVLGNLLGNIFAFDNNIVVWELIKASIHNLSITELCIFVGVAVLMLIGGYLIYAILFAILGAISNENTNVQQFSFILTMPLLISFIFVTQNLGSNDATLIFLSYFPLTSPIALIARFTGVVSAYEIATSIIILYATIAICLRYAATIYRKGIVADKNKITIKTILKWIAPER